MSAGRALLPIGLCLLTGCVDQSLYVADLRAESDEDGGRDEAGDGGRDEAGAQRKDGGAARCTSCGAIFGPAVPGSCTANLPWTLACIECGCCDEARDCAREWERDRRYGCEERLLPDKRPYGACVELDKRPNGGGP